MLQGTAFQPKFPSTSTVIELPYDTGYDQGDNNNGITIIDITALDQVAYCFADFFGMESAEVPLHTPLTAWQYVHAYYDDSSILVQDNLADIRTLEDCHLITIATLRGKFGSSIKGVMMVRRDWR